MNLIQNGDFQQGLHFWNIEQGEIYVVDQQQTQSIMLDTQSSISQRIPVTEQTTYALSFQMDREQTEPFQIHITEIVDPNHSSQKQTPIYTINEQTTSPHEFTIHSHIQSIQITIENNGTNPIFIQQIDLQQIETTNTIHTEPKQTSSSHQILYQENFKPGQSIWEHTIINQSQHCGEGKKKVIGHVPTISLQPHTQYVVSMDIKIAEPCTQAATIMMGVYHSVQPHTLFEQIEHTETTNEWVSLQLTYRTDVPQQQMDRIFIQSNLPFSFTNISIVEVKKIFHENFQQPSIQWNHVQTHSIDNKQAAYLESNTQISASLQHLSFHEKENYLATAYIKHTSKQDATATCYIEYKNNQNGVFIRKPISIPSHIQTWNVIKLPFTTPEAPWSVSAIGFTYQGDQRLWVTEVAIEPHSISNHATSTVSFESHKKWKTDTPSQSDTNVHQNSTSKITAPPVTDMEYTAAAVTETPTKTEYREQLVYLTSDFTFATPWTEYQKKQAKHYKQFLVDTHELSKIEQYMNHKQVQSLSLRPNTKVINLSALQHLDAVPTAYRMDHCLQQLTKECYLTTQLENIHVESYIQSFLQQMRSVLQSMNPEGIFILLPKQENIVPLVAYQNNQILLQAHTTVSMQNESFLQHLYNTYDTSSSPFQSIDSLFHNLLYGMGLKWYEEMKTTYNVSPSVLTTLYQNHKPVFQDWFSVTFDTEESYYATLFQIMYSPVFITIAMAIKQQLPPIVNPNVTFTNGIDCIRTYMQQS